MILPLEALAEEFAVVIRRLCSFFSVEDTGQSFSQIPANTRATHGNTWGLRRMLLFKSLQGRFELSAPHALTGRSRRIELTPGIADRIMSHFGESNRALDDLFDIDLRQFGYC